MAGDAGPIEPAARGLSLTGRPLPDFAEPVSAPMGATPPRRPQSIRRTMSIDVHWPDGPQSEGHYFGRCRDILTDSHGHPPEILRQAEISVVELGRQILSISATPAPQRLQQLVGVRAGGYLREALNDAVAEEKASGTPLYLLLDDLAGSTLVSRWTYSRWHDHWRDAVAEQIPQRKMEGVCIGFRPGSSALSQDGFPAQASHASRVVALPNPADPHGWHDLPSTEGPHFRRARWIDVWREGDDIMVDSLFQDSASAPDGGDRWAIHEYRLAARIGAEGHLMSLDATAGTLPYAACRVAYMNNEVLIGTSARDLRLSVLEKLKHTGGCTHLNDCLRALAETPVLAEYLPRG